jgi:carboxyl-terminal processing protease
MLTAALAAVGTTAALTVGYHPASIARAADQSAAAEPGQQVATVEQLKAEAFRALRGGEFAQVEKLLGQAATQAPSDPTLGKMVGWAKQFEAQRQEFAGERNTQYEKAVEDVRKLQRAGMLDYAPDAAARAYLLTSDKKNFRSEPWVDELVKTAVARAEDHERNERWLKALRLYSDLGSLEPGLPVWKERLKTVTRRVRLIALYTPTVLKASQEAESKEREAADAILKPPSTQPATKPANEDAESFRTDWKDTLRGVRMDLLWDALVDARNNYYRDTSYKSLALGGLGGLRTLVTTKGLEKAFPDLGDDAKRQQFLAFLEERISANKDATAAQEQGVLRDTLSKLKAENARTVELPEQVLVSEFADGAFAELDPFTSMIWPSDLDEFRKSTQGAFFGVGIQIQSDEDGSLKVISPLEDTPAYKAGVKAGDIITHINGKSAKGISTTQAVRTITGPKGTFVKLTLRSLDGTSKDYNIQRDEIKVASIKGYQHKAGGGWHYYIDPENKIAYVRLTNFTAETGNELNAAIADLEKTGAKGIILDLRYNPGGLLTAAIEVCDKFLSDGVIVSTRPDRPTANGPTVARATKNADESTLPLVVLVNQYSASASEIVSGALKDQHRATIVGERTFGKGSVQMLYPLTDRSALLKLTTSHYYLPAGKCIHREENSTDWGVEPDLTVEMTPEQMRAANDARQDLDVLRSDDPAKGPDAGDQQGAAKPEAEIKPIDPVKPQVKPEVFVRPDPNAKPDPVQLKPAKGPDGEPAVAKADPSSKPAKKKDLLSADPQLSAAVLLLRLELADVKAKG